MAKAKANGPRALGFTDVYRNPAFGTDDFLHLAKPSEALLESITALRVLAGERVKHLVESAGHKAA